MQCKTTLAKRDADKILTLYDLKDNISEIVKTAILSKTAAQKMLHYSETCNIKLLHLVNLKLTSEKNVDSFVVQVRSGRSLLFQNPIMATAFKLTHLVFFTKHFYFYTHGIIEKPLFNNHTSNTKDGIGEKHIVQSIFF